MKHQCFNFINLKPIIILFVETQCQGIWREALTPNISAGNTNILISRLHLQHN